MVRRYDPFREMEEMFNNALRQPNNPVMPLDIYREGDRFVALLDLPGIDPESVDIDVEDRTITIRAERQEPKEGELNWITRERPFGQFARQLTVGYGVALDKISASYNDGVLELVIPVAEEAKPRKITVERTAKKAISQD